VFFYFYCLLEEGEGGSGTVSGESKKVKCRRKSINSETWGKGGGKGPIVEREKVCMGLL
jgi:hypothetical protein